MAHVGAQNEEEEEHKNVYFIGASFEGAQALVRVKELQLV